MEIPLDLIKQVKISLRRQANLPSYDPNDASFADLPSPEEAAAALDRAAGLQRCRHCDGGLLRGSQSLICVFCGGEPFDDDDVVPEPINFRNTLAFRWFLESLSLNGSEIVPVSVEANNKIRGRTATSNEIPLSDLLDLEIKWPSELEKFGSGLYKEKPVQSKASVSFSGVSAENFFPNGEKGTPYNAATEPSVPINQVQTKEGIQGHNNLTLLESVQKNETQNPKESILVQNNLNLFENAESSKTAPLSTEEASNDSDSGWGAHFQSAPSGGANSESTLFDPFVGSADLSSHMDAVFGPAKDSTSHKKEGPTTIESASASSDWFSDNSWNNSNSGLSGLPQETKVNASPNSGSVVENLKYSSTLTDVDRVQEVQWQNDRSMGHDKGADDGDDSFDDWNDFASSTTTQDPANSWKQTTMPIDDKTSEINLFSAANQPHDTKIVDSFSQQDLFMGEFTSPNVSTEVNKFPTEASVLDRTSDVYAKAQGNSDDIKKERNVFAVESTSKPDDVETILSQMHDLSFMLDSNLSIPPTQEGSKSSSHN